MCMYAVIDVHMESRSAVVVFYTRIFDYYPLIT